MQNNPITFTIPTKEVPLLINALELYIRIGTGQLEDISWILYRNTGDLYTDYDQETMKKHLQSLKKTYFPELERNQHYEINSPAVASSYKNAYDMLQVMRYGFAKSLNNTATIWSNPPEFFGDSPSIQCIPCKIKDCEALTIVLTYSQLLLLMKTLETTSTILNGNFDCISRLLNIKKPPKDAENTLKLLYRISDSYKEYRNKSEIQYYKNFHTKIKEVY